MIYNIPSPRTFNRIIWDIITYGLRLFRIPFIHHHFDNVRPKQRVHGQVFVLFCWGFKAVDVIHLTAHDAMLTSLWCQHEVAMLFWRHDYSTRGFDVIMTLLLRCITAGQVRLDYFTSIGVIATETASDLDQYRWTSHTNSSNTDDMTTT